MLGKREQGDGEERRKGERRDVDKRMNGRRETEIKGGEMGDRKKREDEIEKKEGRQREET